MKKAMGVLGLASLFLMTSCSTKTVIDHDISKYDYYLNLCYAKNKRFMPTLNSLSDYQRLDFTYKLTPSFGTARALVLQVTYDEEQYNQKVSEINTNYQFLNAPVKASDGDYIIPAHEFTYQQYQMRVVDNPRFFYPDGFGMIGISNIKYEIAYLYFHDGDLDLISYKNECKTEEQRQVQMREFVDDYFAFAE